MTSIPLFDSEGHAFIAWINKHQWTTYVDHKIDLLTNIYIDKYKHHQIHYNSLLSHMDYELNSLNILSRFKNNGEILRLLACALIVKISEKNTIILTTTFIVRSIWVVCCIYHAVVFSPYMSINNMVKLMYFQMFFTIAHNICNIFYFFIIRTWSGVTGEFYANMHVFIFSYFQKKSNCCQVTRWR